MSAEAERGGSAVIEQRVHVGFGFLMVLCHLVHTGFDCVEMSQRCFGMPGADFGALEPFRQRE